MDLVVGENSFRMIGESVWNAKTTRIATSLLVEYDTDGTMKSRKVLNNVECIIRHTVASMASEAR